MKKHFNKILGLVITTLTVSALVAAPVSYADYYGYTQSFTGATINGSTNLPAVWAKATGHAVSSEIVGGVYGKAADDSALKITSTATSGLWGEPPVAACAAIANLKSATAFNETETLVSGSYYHFTASVAACDDDFYCLGIYAHKLRVNYTPVSGSAANTGDLGADHTPILGFTKDGDRSKVKLTAWGEDITPDGFTFKTKTWYKLDVIFNGITNTMDTYLNGEFIKTVELSDNISAAAQYNDKTKYTEWHLYLLKYIGVIYDRYSQTPAGAAGMFDNVGFGNYYYGAAKPTISPMTSDLKVDGRSVQKDTIIIPEGITVSELQSLIQSSHNIVCINSKGEKITGSNILTESDRIIEISNDGQIMKYYAVSNDMDAFYISLYKKSSSYQELTTLVESNAVVFGIDLSKTETLKNKANVYKKLYNKKNTVSKLSDIKDQYDLAIEEQKNAEINAKGREFEVQGNAYGTQMMLVIKDGQDLSDISNENLPIYLRPFSANGKFSEAVRLSDGTLSGYYQLYSTANGDSEELFVADIVKADAYVKEVINKSANASELATNILGGENTIGVKSNRFSQYAEVLKSLLFDNIPFTDYKDFSNAYINAEIIAKINNQSVENIEKLIVNNEEKLGIDIENTYNKLNDDGKKILLSELKRENYVGKNFSDVYKKAYAFAAFKSADYYDTLRKYMEEYASSYGINISDTNVCKNVSGVYQKLMMTKDNAVKIEDISALFKSAVASELESEKGSVTVNSGSGGGGGGGNTFTSVNDVIPSKLVFADMMGYEWANDAVKALKERGIIAGVTQNEYEPGRNVTRAEFCKMLATLLNIDGNITEFADVKESDWYSKYVSACSQNGYVVGDGKYFYPNNFIKREDAVTILFRALDNSVSGIFSSISFNDVNEISSYAVDGVNMLSSLGIIQGNEQNEFLPKKSLTRAEAAVIIYKISRIIK